MPSQQYQRVIKSYSDQTSDSVVTEKTDLNSTPLQLGTGAIYLYGYNLYNPNAVDVFLKIWNSSAAPTLGVTVPDFGPFQIPALGSVVLMGTDIIYRASDGMWFAVTTAADDLDTGAPASDIFANFQCYQITL
jgi:hypothetical protein